jgi:hypothetical protein
VWCASAAQQPEDQAQHQAQYDHGREGREESEAWPVNAQVAREPAKRKPGQPRPQQADGGDQQSERDEQVLHRVRVNQRHQNE